jgi:threonine synthase
MSDGLRFVSTRSDDRVLSFTEALLMGLAEDGGLFVPQRVPRVAESSWQMKDSIAALGGEVLPWLSDLDRDEAERTAASALDFPVPLVRLGSSSWEDVSILELFHGPTLSFKDFGARCMASMMARRLPAGQEATILVATSGDTGSAVADGFAGYENIRVVLLYPQGQVSAVQERQLVVRRAGVRTFAVQGTFDDCQRMVKEAFRDERTKDLTLSSANSISVGRLIPQSLYYFWARSRLEIDPFFCVPSGNLGNLTGGIMAHLAGMPVRGFLAAHNANDFFVRFLRQPTAEVGPSVRTLSNAMDVGVPSNLERLRHMLSDEQMRRIVSGFSISDADTLTSMRRVYEETGYIADPHTAVGLEAVRRFRTSSGDATPVIVLATAHPAKFPEVVESALGFQPERPARLARYWQQETAAGILEPRVERLIDALL